MQDGELPSPSYNRPCPVLGAGRFTDACRRSVTDGWSATVLVRPDQVTAARWRSARSIHSRLRAWVAANNTGGATPAR